MAMMASGISGNPYDDDHNVLDDDFLNDGAHAGLLAPVLDC